MTLGVGEGRGYAWGLWGLFAGLAAYGSLVPFEFRRLAWDEAVRRFAEIPHLTLGIGARADWVANLVLYVPIAYFGALALAGQARSRLGKVAGATVSLLTAWGLALAVEFTQLYLPRTVSRNDLVAEGLGSLLGVAIFLVAGGWLRGLWGRVEERGGQAAVAGLWLYVLAYGAYSLFPYDFLLSADEVAARWDQIRGGLFGWARGPYGVVQAALKTATEVGAAAPLGALYVALRGWGGVRGAIAAGVGLGVAFEAAQFFIASGVVQWISVGTRAAGFWAGAWACRRAAAWLVAWREGRLPGWVGAAIALAYLGVLASANWAGRGGIVAVGEAAARLEGLSFVPFYYHYYLPEARALFSALAYVGLYAPAGFLVAAYATAWGGVDDPRCRVLSPLLGFLAALVCEAVKLFLRDARPDVTNVILAAAAAWAGARAQAWAWRLPGRWDAATRPVRLDRGA